MNNLTRMTREEIHDYMDENDIQVFESFTDDDGDFYWGFSGKTGFSTFDVCGLTEDKAKYAAVLFYKLVKEHGVCFGDAELMSGAYAKTYAVQKMMDS